MTTQEYNNIDQLLEQYPWWNAPRLVAARNSDGEIKDAATRLVATLHPTAMLHLADIDIERLSHVSTEDIIERFLRLDDYRIVAKDGDDSDLAAPEIEDDDELVSEEIAEIYEKQGLYAEAIATYRKLSLLNSEKSIYFARLISDIEKKSAKQ
jgi:tetratricopeptide (TPR) repeat protein